MSISIKYNILLFSLLVGFPVLAELPDSTKTPVFFADLEFRPRTELRNGFRQLRTDSSEAAFFTSQRARLNLNFKKEKFSAVLSLQDIRIWGEENPSSNAASVQVFEAFVTPVLSKNTIVKLGKQRIMLDNQRFFAQNDWRQNAGTHDAVNFIYKSKQLESNFVLAYNQNKENVWGNNYTPIGFSRYKTLGISYLNWKNKKDNIKISVLNYFDGFQATNSNKQNFRFTNGGKIQGIGKKITLNFGIYYQHGKNPNGKDLSAFYLNPEAVLKLKKSEIKIGAEIKSGNNISKASSTDRGFQYPYGVAHRFNGTMEYFAAGYNGSAKDIGLIDPYLFLAHDFNQKFSLSIQNHLFFGQHNPINSNGEILNKYLAFENDLLGTYKPNSYSKIELGFSWLLGTESLETINGGDSKLVPFWSYLQITFTPKLFEL